MTKISFLKSGILFFIFFHWLAGSWRHLSGIYLLHWHFKNSKPATEPEILEQITELEESALGMYNCKS